MKKRHLGHFGGIRPTAMERRHGRLMRGPDHNSGTGGNEPKPENAPAPEPADPKPADPKPADSPKDLDAAREAVRAANERADAAEAAAKKAREAADRFKGIDPEKARENAKKVADAEAAAREAERAKATAEGNFERLREIQNEEHQAIVTGITTERDAAVARANAAEARLNKALVTSAFASSDFVLKDTILGPVKAARLYGDHVEVEDDTVVVYDGPRDGKRVKLMDSKGNPLPFDVAIRKLIEADPDRDTFLRNKTVPGAGSKTQDGNGGSTPKDRVSRLAAGIAALREG